MKLKNYIKTYTCACDRCGKTYKDDYVNEELIIYQKQEVSTGIRIRCRIFLCRNC